MSIIRGNKDPYKILGLTRFNTEKEAKARYRELSKIYHPDTIGTGDEDKFKEVNDAWKELNSRGASAFGNVKKAWTHKTLFSLRWR